MSWNRYGVARRAYPVNTPSRFETYTPAWVAEARNNAPDHDHDCECVECVQYWQRYRNLPDAQPHLRGQYYVDDLV